MWLMCECRRDVSLPMIGRALGGRDHTTVMHGLRSAKARQGHPAFKAWMDDCRVRAVLTNSEIEP
jgi:chromosomal replication initiation ATPase DnaA